MRFSALCEKAGVPVQVFTNRADEPGGSTLGNLQSHTLPIPMADIGCAQLAMHSAVETASVADAEAMIKAVAAFYRVHLRASATAPTRWNDDRTLRTQPQRADAPGQPDVLPARLAERQKARAGRFCCA